MELVQSYGAVLYDRVSAVGLSFFVFPAPAPDSEEPWDWEWADRTQLRHFGIEDHCVADPLSLPHALVPMLAGLPVTHVAAVTTAAKDDPQSIRQRFSHSLVEMAEYAATAPILPSQGTPSGFQSLARVASQLRGDPGTVVGAPFRSSVTPLLVVFGQDATVLVKSTTPGDADYRDHNLLDEFLRRTFTNVRIP
jgi:hypothetical protein